MAPKEHAPTKRPIAAYEHADKERLNNPPAGLVTPDTDGEAPPRTYAYDPHLDPQLSYDSQKVRDDLANVIEAGLAADTLEDAKAALRALREAQAPQLVWAGKPEHTAFEVPTVSLHVHERIDPCTIIEAVQTRNGVEQQLSLFERASENPPLREAIDFYRHAHGWSNRLVAGDSLLVMNSLLEKEGMAGKVQMIYFDPPYGIRYGSNFQPFVNKRSVTDGKDEDLTAEPEQIRAFRDTWELGVHSYLAYLRDRLLLARELLTESGSVFVQIGDENVHHVRELMGEVFGAESAVVTIVLKKKGATTPTDPVNDFVLWYGRDKEQVRRSVQRLYQERRDPGDDPKFNTLISRDGKMIRTNEVSGSKVEALVAEGWRWARVNYPIVSQDYQETRSQPYVFRGRVKRCGTNRHWSFDVPRGLDRLGYADRLFDGGGTSLAGIVFWDDWPFVSLSNVWDDLKGEERPQYVVQTTWRAIERCMLMTTDPGDLVFDPTCGSGTTAYVAEQWGRRWITCDTSRVALTLAKQRLMTAVYDYYELAHPQEGVGSGFVYKTVPHITLKSIANNPEIREGMTREEIEAAIARHAPQETLYDQPTVDRRKRRVSGPFTVEAVPAPAVRSVEDLLPSPTGRGAGGEGKKPLDPELLAYARQLRKGQTDAERVLWGLLRDRRLASFKFRRQAPVEPYVLDFFCHEAQLAIELDGGQHNEPAQQERDEKRTAFLAQRGIRVLRFWNNEVLTSLEGVLQTIYTALTHTLTPPLSPREREWGAEGSIARSGETLRQGEWRDELLRTGIRGKAGQYIRFARLEPLPGLRWLHADGETRPSEEGAATIRERGTAYETQRIVVSFGPEHAPLGQHQVGYAIEEAQTLVPRPRLIVFAAFQFDPEAAKDIDETNWRGVTLLKAQMNADLLTEDLKKKRASNESFWLIGQPDVQVERIEQGDDKGKLRVSVHGFDYYNTRTGGIESGGEDKIAVWMLDTDYDGRSLFPRQVFFPMAGAREGWARLARSLRAEIDEDLIEAYRGTVSLPFAPGTHKRIAVKIVDDRGIESLSVLEVE